MNRFDAVRELVKDPSLRVTDIAKQTGYNKGHVSRLRKEAMKNSSDFECPRCGHCCKTDLARVGEVGVWGKELEKEPLYWVYADDISQDHVDEIVKDEQEPVAWRSTSPDGKLSNKFACKPTEGNWVEPLYTAPQKKEWVGLTDEEAKKTFEEHNCVISADLAGILARAIEAKLKERNT
jgi:hypothetical protein